MRERGGEVSIERGPRKGMPFRQEMNTILSYGGRDVRNLKQSIAGSFVHATSIFTFLFVYGFISWIIVVGAGRKKGECWYAKKMETAAEEAVSSAAGNTTEKTRTLHAKNGGAGACHVSFDGLVLFAPSTL
jgi:hypothetical protein